MSPHFTLPYAQASRLPDQLLCSCRPRSRVNSSRCHARAAQAPAFTGSHATPPRFSAISSFESLHTPRSKDRPVEIRSP